MVRQTTHTTFSIGQITMALRIHERTARGYLHEVNARIDRYAMNLAERVDAYTLYLLYKRHRNTMVGRRLVPLLERA